MTNSSDKIASASERIKQALSIRNMKQVELSEKSGINKPSISCYISGKYEPKQTALYDMGKALNVSEMWLAGYDVPMERTEWQENNAAIADICEKNMEHTKDELKNRLQYALDTRQKKAVDLSNDLDIPKSAISQYLSGKSQNMDSTRLYKICNYLNVSEPWMLGYDVPMERTEWQKNNDAIADIILRLRTNEDFLSVVESIYSLDDEQLEGVKHMLNAFLK